jgi:hypothetical protein
MDIYVVEVPRPIMSKEELQGYAKSKAPSNEKLRKACSTALYYQNLFEAFEETVTGVVTDDVRSWLTRV